MNYNKTYVDVLGVRYKVEYCDSNARPLLEQNYGYVDFTSKTITICNSPTENDVEEIFINHIVRHEVIHAFMYESGLHDSWQHGSGQDETIVDWIAIQLPKINKALEALEVLDE